MAEMPSITSSNYTTTTTSGADWFKGGVGISSTGAYPAQMYHGIAGGAGADQLQPMIMHAMPAQENLEARARMYAEDVKLAGFGIQPKKENTVTTRIVKVFIADIDSNLPLASQLLYRGDEQLTDATDQELFFELDISGLLRDHNKIRTATLNKAATTKAGKDVFLEPVKVRDLKMSVVNVATF